MYWTHKGIDIKDVCFETIKIKRNGKSVIVCNDIFAFDIEVSSGYVAPYTNECTEFDRRKYEDSVGKRKKYYDEFEKVSIMYVWQFSINENVYMGRTWNDFLKLLDDIENGCGYRKIIYVHNLSYELHHMLNCIKFDKVFARNVRKPITAHYNSFEFRCSYFLTRLSLENWAKEKDLPVKKMKGFLKYETIRTPLTHLNLYELEYCMNDVLVMFYGLKEYRQKYGNVHDIPLTQTGEVRKEVRELMREDRANQKKCIKLLPESLESYKELISIFSGGITHANYLYADTVIEKLKAWDICSSYPFVMCMYKYPFTPFVDTVPLRKYFNNEKYSFIVTFKCKNVVSRLWNTFYSRSKILQGANIKADNGRILEADWLLLRMTNIDYDLFQQSYSYDDMEIINFKISINEYLSPIYVKYILKLFKQKNELKGRDDKINLYMQSKQFINALFGLMVTKEICDEVIFNIDNNKIWDYDYLTEESFYYKIDKMRKKPSRVFTSYQAGVWITAYARRALWSSILYDDGNIKMDDYTVYCDTDSNKNIAPSDVFFKKYNNEIKNMWLKRAKMLDICENDYAPFDINGQQHVLGCYEYEGMDDKFITLGAKKYCEDKGGVLKMTVAGVRKSAVSQIDVIEQFEPELVFDTEHTGKVTFYYNDKQPKCVWNRGRYDEWISEDRYGICAMPTTYTLNVTPDYTLLLNNSIDHRTRILTEG